MTIESGSILGKPKQSDETPPITNAPSNSELEVDGLNSEAVTIMAPNLQSLGGGMFSSNI